MVREVQSRTRTAGWRSGSIRWPAVARQHLGKPATETQRQALALQRVGGRTGLGAGTVLLSVHALSETPNQGRFGSHIDVVVEASADTNVNLQVVSQLPKNSGHDFTAFLVLEAAGHFQSHAEVMA